MSQNFKQWLDENLGGVSDREIARRADVSPSAVGRWTNAAPKVQTVVAVCRAFGLPIVKGLVAAGHVEPHEVTEQKVVHDPEHFDTTELLQELSRRVGKDSRTLEPHRPARLATVTPITSPDQYPDEIPEPDYEKAAAADIALPDDTWAE